jgi:hypothetical protein
LSRYRLFLYEPCQRRKKNQQEKKSILQSTIAISQCQSNAISASNVTPILPPISLYHHTNSFVLTSEPSDDSCRGILHSLNGSLNQTFYREVCKSLNGRSKESSNESSKKSGDNASLCQVEYWKESQRNRQKAEKHAHPQRYCKNAEDVDQHQTKLRVDEKIKQTLSILLFQMTIGAEITLSAYPAFYCVLKADSKHYIRQDNNDGVPLLSTEPSE